MRLMLETAVVQPADPGWFRYHELQSLRELPEREERRRVSMIVKLVFKDGVVKSYADVDWFLTFDDKGVMRR